MAMPFRLAATMLAALLAPGLLGAAVFKLFPVRIELTSEQPVQTMTIENDSDEASRVQLRLYAWRQEGERDIYEETREVLANPGLFEIAPRRSQIARFGLRTSPGATEKAYRVFLEEVPTDRPSVPGEVRTLLRISVPIFVPPAQPAARLSWRVVSEGGAKVAFLVQNEGNVHVQLNRLTLKRAGDAVLGSEDMSVYLLPGTSRRVTLEVSSQPRAGERLKLEAMTDQADLSVDLVLEAAAREAGRP
ncbi:fimbrial chaperone protein [Sphingopyxis sp. OAS728]|nr:fimbrial chaperone protein [Sphingopyxis sp. OAS728]